MFVFVPVSVYLIYYGTRVLPLSPTPSLSSSSSTYIEFKVGSPLLVRIQNKSSFRANTIKLLPWHVFENFWQVSSRNFRVLLISVINFNHVNFPRDNRVELWPFLLITYLSSPTTGYGRVSESNRDGSYHWLYENDVYGVDVLQLTLIGNKWIIIELWQMTSSGFDSSSCCCGFQ